MDGPSHPTGPASHAAGPASHAAGPASHGAGRASHGAGRASHDAADAACVACAVITVSDTRSEQDDRSGAEIRRGLEAAGHRVEDYRIVRDEPHAVRDAIRELQQRGGIDVVLLTGGTGVAARDTTFEAVSALLTKRIDGFGELFRMLSFAEIGAAAMLSRAVAGLAGTTVVFSMPGSTGACRLAMEKLILPQLAHVVGLVRPPRA